MENKSSTCHMTNEKRLIDANELFAQIHTLSVTVTGLRSGKGVLNEFMKHYRESVLRIVDDAPTVDAVPVVHARWHDVYLLSPWVATGVCGHCKLTSYINPDFPHAKHCPNCGAKMDGGNEDGVQ